MPTGPSFRILTYNVNWGMTSPYRAIDLIRQANADIVCLQETTPGWEDQLRSQLAGLYPFMEFRNSDTRAAGGFAFLSKQAGTQIAYIISMTGWFDGWIMAFQTPVGPVQVLNVHLQPPVNDKQRFGVSGLLRAGEYHQREIERFYSQRKTHLPTLVTGDFNEADRGSAIQWLEQNGMTNALPEFDRHTPTWRWSVGWLPLRRRMDHILYSSELYCYAASVLRAGDSDHWPVLALFGSRQE